MMLFNFRFLFSAVLAISVSSTLFAPQAFARDAGMSRHNGSPTLGLLVDDVPFHTLDALALTHGVQIVRVISESPARAAGLREGDILVEVNGRPVFSVARLRWLVRRAQPGRPLNVAFNRAGAIASVSVTPDLTRSSN